MSENKQAYISRVHLKGYKSIRDMAIDLLPGLNIIIGPNGSGKTNFVDFMTYLNRFGYENQLYQKEFSVEFIQNNIEKTKIRNDSEYNFPTFISIDQKITIKGHGHSDIKNGKYLFNVIENIESTDSIFDSTLKYIYNGSKKDFSTEKSGNSNQHQILGAKKITFSNPLNFISPKSSIELIHQALEYDESHPEHGSYQPESIVKSAFEDIEHSQNAKLDGLIRLVIYLWNQNDISIGNEQFINEVFDYLSFYSPISEITLDKTVIVSKKQGNEEKISNIINALKFKIQGQWWFWDDLSDGTKRLFYIICEVASYNELVLIEEPELGIHPHQFIKLMDFLKEQSNEKQIVITTHSPEVLNRLNYNELDSIIVSKYSPKMGTEMYKLDEQTQQRIEKGTKEKGLFIGDYWVNLDVIEKKEEEVEL